MLESACEKLFCFLMSYSLPGDQKTQYVKWHRETLKMNDKEHS